MDHFGSLNVAHEEMLERERKSPSILQQTQGQAQPGLTLDSL